MKNQEIMIYEWSVRQTFQSSRKLDFNRVPLTLNIKIAKKDDWYETDKLHGQRKNRCCNT